MKSLAELLADCDSQGIRLIPAENGGLTIDAPQAALTSDLIRQIKPHKADLLARLRPESVAETPDSSFPDISANTASHTTGACRCGSRAWSDVPIHDGQSTRRDCVRCRRFIDFPVWYGKNTLHNEQ